MITYKRKRQPTKKGRGLINKAINKLPIELHIPGYQYCGPGTKLQKRLARGDPGINLLDAACKEHDIAYNKNKDIVERNIADRILAEKAWRRVLAQDSGIGEKAAAYAISNTMKLKSKLGLGLKKRKGKKTKKSSKKRCKKSFGLKKVIKAATFKWPKNKTARTVIGSALKKARAVVKKAGGKSKILTPRILPIPKRSGGALPFLIPLFAGLSATGALAGGAAGIAKAINDAKSAKHQLEESQRHNKTMEAIALGKGMYLKPHKTGLGLHLKPYGSGLKKKKTSN